MPENSTSAQSTLTLGNPLETHQSPFLSLAKEARAQRLADGVGMLVEQAAEVFHWWRGVRPLTRDLIHTLMIELR